MIKRRSFLTTLALAAGAKAAEIRPAGGKINRARINYDQAGFSPDTISGLKLWLKADALALNDNDAVASWTDSSGLGNHAVQATEAAKPTYKTAIINGKPVVRFDGIDDVLAANATANAARTVFLLTKMRSAPSGTSRVVITLDTAADNAQIAFTNSGVSAAGWCYYSDQAAASVVLGGTAADATILGYTYGSAASLTVHHNGTSVATFDPHNAYSTAAALRIGTGRVSGFSDSDVGEIIIYDTALSAGDRQSVERYLGTRWGIAVP